MFLFVGVELKQLSRDTHYLLDEIQCVSEVEGLVVGVVVGIRLLQKVRPDLEVSVFVDLLAIDEVGLEKAFEIL